MIQIGTNITIIKKKHNNQERLLKKQNRYIMYTILHNVKQEPRSGFKVLN